MSKRCGRVWKLAESVIAGYLEKFTRSIADDYFGKVLLEQHYAPPLYDMIIIRSVTEIFGWPPRKKRRRTYQMKRIIAIITAFALAMSMMILTSCSSDKEANNEEKPEVTVLAAASLTDALDEIIAEFEKDSDCKITPSYAGSGDLVQQIEGGAPCDIFISASKSNMDQLEEGEYIDTETREDLLKNTLTLISTVEKKDVVSMDSLTSADVGTIAVGEPETVPAGKYASQVFDNLKITDQLTDKIVYAKDVRAVLNYVETGDADCGFVYRTDALLMDEANGVIIGDVDESLHDAIVYPAAIMAEPPAGDHAAEFFEFMKSDFAKKVFEKYGFTVAQ